MNDIKQITAHYGIAEEKFDSPGLAKAFEKETFWSIYNISNPKRPRRVTGTIYKDWAIQECHYLERLNSKKWEKNGGLRYEKET